MYPSKFVYFVEEWFPGRWPALEERVQEAMENHEKPDYAYWINWYSTRPKGETWVKWFRKGSEL